MSFLNLFQHGGTNFTAFRIIDTSKPEVKAVIHDIVNKEIAQGREIELQVKTEDFLRGRGWVNLSHYGFTV